MKNIKFVGLHAHSGVGSPFDGFGYPQDHMDFCYENGGRALALTDHGNMSGLAYQVLHAKQMEKEGRDFKPIYGCEVYFVPSITEWEELYEKQREDKKKAKRMASQRSESNIEAEGETKSRKRNPLNNSRHLVLLAMNQEGLNNLYKMVSESHTQRYYYRKPRIDYALLSKYSSGVIGMSACLGGVYAGNYWEHHEEGKDAVLAAMRETTTRMVDIFGDRWYGELQWNNVPEQHELNQHIIEMHKEFGIKLTSTADSHYPNPEAWKHRELYKRIGWLGRGIPEWLDMNLPIGVEEIGYELYPKNGDQMWESYEQYSKECGYTYDDDLVLQSIEETHHIAFSRIEKFFPDNTVRLPSFIVPEGADADKHLGYMAAEGMHDILRKRGFFGKQTKSRNKMKAYSDRLEHEMKVISSRGFSKYFLTMKAVCDFGKANFLMGPARGSAAGSLVAYALGISQVDPIKYNLLFSRFLRSDATDYPDIDVDFSNAMGLKELLVKEWGWNTAVPISNYNTLQLRSLIKDISKFYDIPFTEVNAVTNTMMSEATPRAKARHGIKAGVYTPTFEEVIEFSDSLQKFFKNHPEIKDHVIGLVGQIRSKSRHAGGILIGEDLDMHMPLISSKGVIQTPWSEGQNVRQLEPMGFIKFDLLGLSTLQMFEACIRRVLQKYFDIEQPTFEQIRNFYEERLHPDVLNLNDSAVFENIFHNGKFAGIFQFANSGMQELCKKVKPNSIEDISAVSAIYRPGPLSANVDKLYLEAKKAPHNISYEHRLLEPILKDTYGLIIFQEQISQIATTMGNNITPDDGNTLRKLLTKKGLSASKQKKKDEIYDNFISGCVDKDMPRKRALALWQKLEFFGKYGFNLSHSISYGIISYQCAWLYHNYESEWMCSFLDKEPETRKEHAINIAKSHGFDVLPVSLNKSDRDWKSLDGNVLVAPLMSIKGLGEKAIDQILQHRPFRTAEELLFTEGVSYRAFNKKAIDVLIRAGAMTDLIDGRFTGDKHFWSAVCVDKPKTKKKLLENIETYRAEKNFSEEERISSLTSLTGIFPFHLVLPQEVQDGLRRNCIPPISEFDKDLGIGWLIPREVTKRKTKTGKPFYVVTAIDGNSETTRIRCWGVDPEKDVLHLNRPYIIKPQYNDAWGFSTRGPVGKCWKLLS